jgi:hypothetical protein
MCRIWAVAKNTIKQALRLKIAIVFLALLVIFLPLMSYTSTGDGTVKGKLQTFVSYGLSFTSFLLCLLTIIISIYTVSSDIEGKQLFTVVTKPIRRYEIILGKLLGVMTLDFVLVLLFSVLIYSFIVHTPKYADVDRSEMLQLQNEFFTARIGLVPAIEDVSDLVQASFKDLEDSGMKAELYPGLTDTEIKNEITNLKRLEKRAAVPGQELVWEFRGVRPADPNDYIFIKFKFNVSVNPPDEKIVSGWTIGDLKKYKSGSKDISTRIYRGQRTDPINTFREIVIPADAVSDDGYLGVAFYNIPANEVSVIFPLQDGIEVLYQADNFTSNYIKAVVIIFCRLVFLACLGVLSSTFLSFPVAMLLCLVIFLTGTISGFILESFDSGLSEGLNLFYSYTIKLGIYLLPRFDKYNPTEYLVSAKYISLALVGRVVFFMVCLKAFILVIISIIVFSFKEIARITI